MGYAKGLSIIMAALKRDKSICANRGIEVTHSEVRLKSIKIGVLVSRHKVFFTF